MRQRWMVLCICFLALVGAATGAKAEDPFAAFKGKNYQSALAGFLKLAEQGNPNAMNNLGLMYANGLGVKANFATARGWYEKAAGIGHVGAINNLGGMYETGQGVSQNYAEAANKYAIAARYGLSDAQYNLGALYESGHGLPNDQVQAFLWYSLAAAQGDADAAVARDRVGAAIDPVLRKQAAAYAKSWKPAQ